MTNAIKMPNVPASEAKLLLVNYRYYSEISSDQGMICSHEYEQMLEPIVVDSISHLKQKLATMFNTDIKLVTDIDIIGDDEIDGMDFSPSFAIGLTIIKPNGINEDISLSFDAYTTVNTCYL